MSGDRPEDPRSTILTSTSLLESLRQSDNRDAWHQFVERYRPMIVGYGRKTFGLAADDAEDTAQTILAEFYDSYVKGRYDRGKGRLRKWLFGIAMNHLRNAARQRARRREVQAIDDSDGTAFVHRIPDGYQLEQKWEEQWRQAVYRHCLRELEGVLEPKTMAAFEMFVEQEWPAQDVADHLNMTCNAVYHAKHRVLTRIREMIPALEDLD